jgi:oxygen-dependent protoporphyrinogen oxidase
VVVVGGGIAGLAAAWELSGGADGPTSATPRIEVVESTEQVGGGLRSTQFDGRAVDQGADGFLARRPEAVQLVRELGWFDHLEAIGAQGAWLYLGGRLQLLSEGLVLGIPTSRKTLRSLHGLSRRARYELWRDEHFPRAMSIGDDATVGEIVRRKLGDEVAEHIVEPMIGGIQAGRIDGLSAAAVFPALLEAARQGGSLMRAIATQGPANPGPAAPRSDGPAFYTLVDTIGALPRELARQLTERGVIFTVHTPVTALRRTPASFYTWEVDTPTTTTPANAVVLATPASVTASLLGSLDPALSALADVHCAGAAMVTFAVPLSSVDLPKTGTGVLVPLRTPFETDDTYLTTAVTLLDRKWNHLRNEQTALVRVHVGRVDDRRCESLGDDELAARVRREMVSIFGRWPDDVPTMVVRWPDRLPQYATGHLARVSAARAAAEQLGVALCGNAYDGVGIPASVGSGRRAGAWALNALAV